MKMKFCDDCKTYSIPGNNVCLNCKTKWIYVTKRKHKMILYLVFIVWLLALYQVIRAFIET